MAYFISEGIFKDAFILHDPSNHYTHIFDMIQSIRKHRQCDANIERFEQHQQHEDEQNYHHDSNNNNLTPVEQMDQNNKKDRKKKYRPREEYFLTLQSSEKDGILYNSNIINSKKKFKNLFFTFFLDRKDLYLNWARVRNMLKSQPLDSIRAYYGEVFAFYFAWMGSLIFMLFIPAVFGFGFFLYGIIKR